MTKTYYAIVDKKQVGYIVEADSKKQMKEKGMNMRLNWQISESYQKAKGVIETGHGYELASAHTF